VVIQQAISNQNHPHGEKQPRQNKEKKSRDEMKPRVTPQDIMLLIILIVVLCFLIYLGQEIWGGWFSWTGRVWF
jgi:quinol-cytochrome oxidoreductase complex cytochrome b subunit